MLTLDSATEFLFGKSTSVLQGGVANEKGVKFGEAFTYATARMSLQTRLGKLAVILPDKKFKDSVTLIHEYVQNYVQKALDKKSLTLETPGEANSRRYVFLEELAKTGYSEKKIQDELLNILLAGRDTTAGLLSYLFHYLARRPDVFDKLRAEVMALGNDEPTFEDMKGMKYLQYCRNIPQLLLIFPLSPCTFDVSHNSSRPPPL